MRKWLLIVMVLSVPTTVQAASSTGSALLGIAIGAVVGIYATPYVLPTVIAAAPVVVETVSAASTAVGDAIAADPIRAGGIIGGLLGYWLAP